MKRAQKSTDFQEFKYKMLKGEQSVNSLPCFVVTGSRGVVPDPNHQAGAAAATAAGCSAGGSGERQCSSSAGQTHQRHPSAYGSAAGLRLHFGQLHHPADEDPSPRGGHRPADLAAVRPVEAVGLCGAVAAAQLSSLRDTPEGTRAESHKLVSTQSAELKDSEPEIEQDLLLLFPLSVKWEYVRTKHGQDKIRPTVFREVFTEKKKTSYNLSNSNEMMCTDVQSSTALLSPKTAFLARHLWTVFSNYL